MRHCCWCLQGLAPTRRVFPSRHFMRCTPAESFLSATSCCTPYVPLKYQTGVRHTPHQYNQSQVVCSPATACVQPCYHGILPVVCLAPLLWYYWSFCLVTLSKVQFCFCVCVVRSMLLVFRFISPHRMWQASSACCCMCPVCVGRYPEATMEQSNAWRAAWTADRDGKRKIYV